MADSAYETRLEDPTLTKDYIETALKVFGTMSPAEVQERLNAEELRTQKKETTKKKHELASSPHTYRRTVEKERRRRMFESASTEEDDTEDELLVSQKRGLLATPGPKKKAKSPRKATVVEMKDAASESSSEEGTVASPSQGQTKCLVKLMKYDGTTAFETFWAQFQNIVEYHQWTKRDQLFYLKSCLKDQAAQVLWDYGTEVPKSLSKLTKVLKDRFGGEGQKEKYRMELKTRRRRVNETLEDLHVDIRRLAVLTFPTMEYTERERISCEYFIDALDDPDLILRVRERDPKSLDEALRTAQKLELWKKDTERRLGEEKKPKLTKDNRKVREVSGEEPKVKSLAKSYEELKKDVEEQKKRAEKDFAEYKKQADSEIEKYKRDMERQINDLQRALKEASAAPPSTPRSPVLQPSSADGAAAKTSYACYGCGSRL